MTTTTTTMTSEQVTEIKNYAEVLTKAIEADWLNPNGSAHSTDYWMRCAVEQARAIPKLVAEVERLRAQMAEVEKFVAARAEYITAINNCNPENSADYWRWQGHAEGRRQLSQMLGLPVAWPAEYKGGEGR